MPAFKPAYLIHGDDHGRVAERRARLRMLAEGPGASGAEVIDGESATPDAVAAALNAMTFSLGRRFIVVDGVERWKDRELDGLIEALGAILPDTTIAFFAREDTRAKAPGRLHEAVAKAGGDISPEQSLKPWELPKWVSERAREMGLTLQPDAARALVAHVGERQQRLLRELEKLALGAQADVREGTRAGTTIDAEQIEELTAASAERKVWSLGDAMLAGEAAAATRLYLALRAQGERVPGLLYWISQRLRLAHDVANAIEAGEPVAQIKRGLRMPSRAADRLIAEARRSGVDRLRQAIVEMADLELASRGGGSGATGEDTAALLAIQRIAA